MDQTIKDLFEEIECQRQDLSKRIMANNESQLNESIRPGAWTVSQIVEHLVLSDETLGRAVDSRVAEAEPVLFRVIPRSWRFALILDALNKNVKLPLPTPLVNPTGKVSIQDLLIRWERAREKMRADLNWLTADDRRYFHPALGLLSASQILKLVRVHTAYHHRQIDSLLQADAPSK
jgi:hypothetical protein